MNIKLTCNELKGSNQDRPSRLRDFPAFDRLWTKREFLEARLIERKAAAGSRKSRSIIVPPWRHCEGAMLEAR